MKINQKRIFDAGVSQGYESGLEINDGEFHQAPFIRTPKSLAGTNGTYAISESHALVFSNGIYNNPGYNRSGSHNFY